MSEQACFSNTQGAFKNEALATTWVSLSLLMCIFLMPLSSTLKDIALVMVCAGVLLFPTYNQLLPPLCRKPWFILAIFLFLQILVSCLWTPASGHEQLLALKKYSKLLYLPLCVVGFKDQRVRFLGLHVLLLSMLLVAGFTFLKMIHVLHWRGDDPGEVFRNHIMTGFMMSFAAGVGAYFAIITPGIRRYAYLLCSLLLTAQIFFIGTGRTGYVVYVVMMSILFFSMFSFRHALVLFFLGALGLVTIFYSSPTMHARVTALASDYQQYQQADKNTAIGYRVQFHAYAKTLFLRHPWLGNGAASFRTLYTEEQPVTAWGKRLLEPHSNYWLVASEQGLLGVLTLLALLAALFYEVWGLKTLRVVGLMLWLPFVMANFTDSFLFYSGTGYFFILFMGLCLAEGLEKT
jgi:O-antigen ligase